MPARAVQLALRIAITLAIVAATTFTCLRLIHANVSTAGFAYLLGVLAIATGWGLVEALLASVAAALCFNFFFMPPVGQFTIADTENWVALFAFLATALVASRLSDRAKKQALEAKQRQRETEQLYALSRSILLQNPAEAIGSEFVRHIADIFDFRAVALYDARSGELFRGGMDDLPAIETKLKEVVMEGSRIVDDSGNTTIAAISLGGQPIGSIALHGMTVSDGALQALLNLVAIALERVRTVETANRAEAARQSEEFKSTLLDAITHEFKTPLTSIKAASTSMVADAASLSPQFRELATIIDEESDRLSRLVTQAARMAQIEAGDLRLQKELLQTEDLLRNVLHLFGSAAEGREIKLTVEQNARVLADRELISLALRQLIDNALKYSPPASPIEVRAAVTGGNVVVRVVDHGPGIPDRERERIFEKFYRRQSNVPGTGLGLFVAREIVRAHGGDVWVEGGSEFCVALPIEAEQ